MLVAIPLVVMLPRLISAQFGFFDDPNTLIHSEAILSGEWSPTLEANEGRFRPLYWYFHTIMYWLFGDTPLGFFLVNTVLIILLMFTLHDMIRRLRGNEIQAWTVNISLLISGPLLESAYTLSKPELLQSIFFALILWLSSIPHEQMAKHLRIILFFIGGAIALFACLTKETGVLLLPISLAIFILMTLLAGINKNRKEWMVWSQHFFLSSSIGVVLYLLIRGRYVPFGLSRKGYAYGFTFDVDYLLQNTMIWLDIITKDYLYLLPLALLAVLLLWEKRRKNHLAIFVAAGIWAIAWLAVYIPWKYTQIYYLLPFAMGVSIFAGAVMSDFIWLIRQKQRWKRYFSWITGFIGVVLFTANAINQITNVKMQLAVDASNEEMLGYVLANADLGSTVLLNIQEPNEYVRRFNDAVRELGGREDLNVGYVQLENLPVDDERTVYYILPVFEHQFYPSFRMGIFEHTSKAWDRALLSEVEGLGEPDHSVRNSFSAFIIDPLRIYCPLTPQIPYCQAPNTPFDKRVVRYGWDIYNIEKQPEAGS